MKFFNAGTKTFADFGDVPTRAFPADDQYAYLVDRRLLGNGAGFPTQMPSGSPQPEIGDHSEWDGWMDSKLTRVGTPTLEDAGAIVSDALGFYIYDKTPDQIVAMGDPSAPGWAFTLIVKANVNNAQLLGNRDQAGTRYSGLARIVDGYQLSCTLTGGTSHDTATVAVDDGFEDYLWLAGIIKPTSITVIMNYTGIPGGPASNTKAGSFDVGGDGLLRSGRSINGSYLGEFTLLGSQIWARAPSVDEMIDDIYVANQAEAELYEIAV